MTSFEYCRPKLLGDALEQLARPEATTIAGGTDFVTLRSSGAIAPRIVVDIKDLDELQHLDGGGGDASIGSAVTMRRLMRLAEPWVAGLRDGASIVGGPLTRNRATVGGNVCRSSPAGDTLPALLVLAASCRIASAERERGIAISDFFTGPGTNVLEPGEVLVALHVRLRDGGSAYERLTYRQWMDLAVVGVAAWVELGADGRCKNAAVAFGGAAPTPRLVPAAADALRGTDLSHEALVAAANAVCGAASPIDDVRGSVRHRLRGLEVLTRRVVKRACRRATGG